MQENKSGEGLNRREFLGVTGASAVTLAALAGCGDSGVPLGAEDPVAVKNLGNENGLPSCDVLVIGSGGAGLRAASWVRKQHPDLSVVVVNKGMPSRNATCMAEGGMNGVINFGPRKDGGHDDHILHFRDTVKGSDFLADQDAVEVVVKTATESVYELDYAGMPWSRNEDGTIATRFAGGAKYERCNYAQDKTGSILMHTCLDEAITQGVKFLLDHYLLDLAMDDEGRCEGVVLLNIQNGTVAPVLAKSVVLATGGYTRVFFNRTSTPFNATGDGIAAALRAGAGFKDPEMLQFHPTGIRNGGALITEAARGIGGRLINNKGERFMSKYNPKMELAPRDIVSRSIELEIRAGNAWGSGMDSYVHLDLTHIGEERIADELPQIRHIGKLFENMDLVNEPLKIRPTAHYSMGGIEIAKPAQMSTLIEGLYACGETSCASIHGANRLGGNSLCDATVTGKLAGLGAGEYAAKKQGFGSGKNAIELAKKWTAKFKEITSGSDAPNVLYDLREEFGAANWDDMGIFRTGEKLARHIKKLEDIQRRYDAIRLAAPSMVFNTALIDYLEFGNLILLARCACLGALNREESRGAHTREDFPRRDDERFLQHTIVTLGKDGVLNLNYKPVTLKPLTPEWEYKPEARKY